MHKTPKEPKTKKPKHLGWATQEDEINYIIQQSKKPGTWVYLRVKYWNLIAEFRDQPNITDIQLSDAKTKINLAREKYCFFLEDIKLGIQTKTHILYIRRKKRITDAKKELKKANCVSNTRRTKMETVLNIKHLFRVNNQQLKLNRKHDIMSEKIYQKQQEKKKKKKKH